MVPSIFNDSFNSVANGHILAINVIAQDYKWHLGQGEC